ncbi:MAG: site-specific integrase [Tannerella sp.]|jgi:integrase|nr:site-specific integrase [Tannerella sp.]
MKRKKSKAVKVTLRFRLLDTGKETLYLDYYPKITDPETGKPSRREYLGMYVVPLKNRNGEFQKNVAGAHKYSPTDNETIRIAEIIRNNRQNELDKANIYTDTEAEMLKAKERSKGDFIQYFKQLSDEKKESNRDNWGAALEYLKNYTRKSDKADAIRFCDITLQWCEGFKNHLLTVETRGNKTLATNTAASYFVKFKTALKSAYRYGYLPKDINMDLKSIKEVETKREFLTLDELKILVNTPCTNEPLKRAALFSALTGLRHSDIIKMKWGEIQETNGLFTLKYTIQKTNKYEELPISSQAVQLCGDRKESDTLVFDGLHYSAYANKALAQWLGAAGITRNVTFHCFRHTFATLQLASGTQITTIQKMLGHRYLATTMVYAKTLEEAKREASEKIKLNI